MNGTLTLGSPSWLGPSLLLLAAATAVTLWSYRGTTLAGKARVAAFGLKLVGFALLALCLVEPSWATKHARPGANLFAVLADNSRGLTLHDRGNAKTRGEVLRAALSGAGAAAAGPAGWLARLSESFQVRRYLFDARLRRSEDFAELRFDGEASHIGTALRTLAERYRGAPLAGVLLLSDGNATDLGADGLDLTGLPPVHTVVVGGRQPQPDIALGQIAIAQTAFEDAPVTIEAQIDTAGQKGETLTAELVDASGKVVRSESPRVAQADETVVARFRLRPEKAGLSFYKVRVAGGPRAQEATTANNQRVILVDRPRGPYRVLYVGGRPNWEFKFLRRAMDEDSEVELVGLIRIAHREPKFTFRGRGGETSNPLFRGFRGKDGDETERYDQPVLVRLGTREAAELRDGFPKTDEDLFGYHAVILDDVEAGFFSADQHALAQRFVTERGGGLLMLGGQGTFRQGGYDRTPIGDLLPVYLDRVPRGPSPQALKLSLSREGWLEPWVRLRDNEAAERERLAAMPAFRFLSRVRAIKPGATVLAAVSNGADKDETYPALVVQRSGNGRVGALTIGDLWRWGLKEPESQQELGKFWRQTVRWLVSDVPERISVRAQHKPGETNQVTLLVRAKDKRFRPADDVSVTVEVTGPDGGKTQIAAEPSADEAGLYLATHVPRGTGGYHVRAKVTSADGAADGEAETGWALDLEADEHRSIRANPGLMAAIAQKTGGQVVALGDLDAFVRDLPALNAPVTETRTRPLWDSWLVFLLGLACLAAEWWIRRTRGLA